MKDQNVTEDKLLVSEFLKGKVVAFDQLYLRYSERLYVFALMLLKNREDARDIVQETFLRIWQKRSELTHEKSFKSFVFTIAYHIIIDHVRKKLNDQKYLRFLEQYFNFDDQAVENTAGFNLLDRQVREVIEELPERRREIFKLSRETGMSHKEISETLNISQKTVETQIGLAIKHIRSRISGQGLALILFLALFY